jgi:hypothetical protein
LSHLPKPPSALVLSHLTPSELQTYSKLVESAHLRATSPELKRRYTPVVIQLGGALASIQNRKCQSANVQLEQLLNSAALLRELEGHVDDSLSLARHFGRVYGAEIIEPEDVPKVEAEALERARTIAKKAAANVGAPKKRG